MKLLEVIPTADTDPAVVAQCTDSPSTCWARAWCSARTRRTSSPTGLAPSAACRGALRARERLRHRGSGCPHRAAHRAPKTATFRLADLAGLDMMVNVAENLYDLVPHDESRESCGSRSPWSGWSRRDGSATSRPGLLQAGGRPGAARVPRDRPRPLEYRPPQEPGCRFIDEANKVRDLGERMRLIMDGGGRGRPGRAIHRATIVPALAYAARRIPEMSDDIVAVDDAMRWGFAQERGTSRRGTCSASPRRSRGWSSPARVAPWVNEMLAAGHTSFYRTENGRTEAYSPVTERMNGPARHGADRSRRAEGGRAGARSIAARA